jgi:hypothetical protein
MLRRSLLEVAVLLQGLLWLARERLEAAVVLVLGP